MFLCFHTCYPSCTYTFFPSVSLSPRIIAAPQPLVDEAKRAVGNIKPEALSEIRSLRMPPDVIRDILEGVLRLMGIFDTSWVSMKRWEGKTCIVRHIINIYVFPPLIHMARRKLDKETNEQHVSKKETVVYLTSFKWLIYLNMYLCVYFMYACTVCRLHDLFV